MLRLALILVKKLLLKPPECFHRLALHGTRGLAGRHVVCSVESVHARDLVRAAWLGHA